MQDPYEAKFAVAGSSALSSLFFEASHLSKSSTETPPTDDFATFPSSDFASVPDPLAVIAKASVVQKKLKDDILLKVPDCVRLAASKGKLSTDVLTFGGNDQYDDFSYLFLLKGPRNKDQRDLLFGNGYVPLLETLRRELVPFEVRHVWVGGTNENRLVLTWK